MIPAPGHDLELNDSPDVLLVVQVAFGSLVPCGPIRDVGLRVTHEHVPVSLPFTCHTQERYEQWQLLPSRHVTRMIGVAAAAAIAAVAVVVVTVIVV